MGGPAWVPGMAGGAGPVIVLHDDATYRERRRELSALEDIVDGGVALLARVNGYAALRPELQAVLEGLACDLERLLDFYLDRHLTVRREALALWEENLAWRACRGTSESVSKGPPEALLSSDRLGDTGSQG